MLAIDADDYGYCESYDEGIVEAALAGAIDGASAMVLRAPDPLPLLETGIAIGLHLEASAGVDEQLEAFRATFAGDPAYLDGHHHCHASEELFEPVAALAGDLGVAVRSVSAGHRERLRALGIATADRLVGRLNETGPVVPAEIAAWLRGAVPAERSVEWMVHPGRPDRASGSSYDAGRGEDLRTLLALGDRERWAAAGIRRGSLAQTTGPA